jgi:hypothetical protein
MLKRLAEQKPQPQPAIDASLAAAPDSAIQIVLVIPGDARKVIHALWPQLPPEVGQVPSTVLTTGFTHATLGIDLPPKPAFKFTIQAKDAAAAQGISNLLAKLPQLVGNNPQVKREFPEFEELVRQLLPKIEQDRLVLNLDDAAGNAIVEQLAHLMQRARAQAIRTQGMSNMRHLLIGGLMHANDNKGQWPQTLEQLAPKYVPAHVLKNPTGRALVYLRPTKFGPDSALIVVMHESLDGQLPVAVGFLDGHVELLRPDQLKQTLDAMKK